MSASTEVSSKGTHLQRLHRDNKRLRDQSKKMANVEERRGSLKTIELTPTRTLPHMAVLDSSEARNEPKYELAEDVHPKLVHEALPPESIKQDSSYIEGARVAGLHRMEALPFTHNVSMSSRARFHRVKVSCGLITDVPSSLRITRNHIPCGIFSVIDPETSETEWQFVKEYDQLRNFSELIRAIIEPLLRTGKARLTEFPPKNLFVRNIPWKVDVRIDMLNAFFKTVSELFLNADIINRPSILRALEQACNSLWIHDIVDLPPESETDMYGCLISKTNTGKWTNNYCILNGAYLDIINESTTGPVSKSISLNGAKAIVKISFFDTTDEDERYSIDIYEKSPGVGYRIHRFSAESEISRQKWISKLRHCIHCIDAHEISPKFRAYTAGEFPKPFKIRQSPHISAYLPAELSLPSNNGTRSREASPAITSGDLRFNTPSPLSSRPNHATSSNYKTKSPNRSSGNDAGFFDGGEFYMKISKPLNFQVLEGSTHGDSPGSLTKKMEMGTNIDSSQQKGSRSRIGNSKLNNGRTTKGNLFGMPIEKCKYLLRLPNNDMVPSIVALCFEKLNNPSTLSEIGLFRMSGTQTLIQDLQSDFDKGGVCDLAQVDPHTVADLLKRYLRQLPRSILGNWSDEKASILLSHSQPEQLSMLHEILERYHPVCISTARCVLRLLYNVSRHENSNAMTTWNLSVALSPSLKVPPKVLKTYIENQEDLFGPIN